MTFSLITGMSMGGTWEHARMGGTLMYFKIFVVGKDNPNKNTLKIKI